MACKRSGVKRFSHIIKGSSLHGVFHLTNAKNSRTEKIIWGVIIWSVIISALYLVALFWVRYITNPTMISLDRNYHEWNTTFPSMTICFHNRMNLTARNTLVDQVKPTDVPKFERFLELLVETDIFTLHKLIDYDEYSDLDLRLILNQITNVVDAKVVLENGVNANFNRVVTDLGICYTFNSAIINLISSDVLTVGTNRDAELIEISIIERDIYAFLGNLTSNGNVYYHGPFDVPSILKRFIVKTSTPSFLAMKFKPTIITADSNIKALYVQQRKCRFAHESNLEFFPTYYSYSICQLDCRIRLYLKYCGCVPYFYKLGVRLPVCRLKQLRCLGDNLVDIHNSLSSCGCLKDCNSIKFTLQSYVLFDWFNDPLIKWKIDVSKVRYTRRIIFSFADAMTSTGGIAVLFFGASAITVIEILVMCIKSTLYACIKKFLQTNHKPPIKKN